MDTSLERTSLAKSDSQLQKHPQSASSPEALACLQFPRENFRIMAMEGLSPPKHHEHPTEFSASFRDRDNNLVSFSRKIPGHLERTARFVARRCREGRRVRLKKQSGLTRSLLCEKAFAKDLETLRAGRHREGTLPSKEIVYEVCQALSEQQSGVKPFVLQVVSALMLHPELGGLNGKRFYDALAFMTSRYSDVRSSYQKRETPWIGSPRPYQETIKFKEQHSSSGANSQKISAKSKLPSQLNLPVLCLTLLTQHSGRIFSSDEILQELFPEQATAKLQKSIDYALQPLELLGLVKKLPYIRDPNSRQPTTAWASPQNQLLNRRYDNPKFVILAAAVNGPVTAKQVYQNSGADIGGVFSAPTIHQSAAFLKGKGLVSLSRSSVSGQKNRPGQPDTVISLTELGKELVSAIVEAKVDEPLDAHRFEKLRKVLLSD